MSYSISQYVSDEIVKYLKDCDEQTRKLNEKVLFLEDIVARDSYITCCTFCDKYKPRLIRCTNWYSGCRFAWCEDCEISRSMTTEYPISTYLFDGSIYNGYTCICTKQCYDTLGDGRGYSC